VREDPTNAQAYFLLGTLAQEARQAKKAADYFRKTVLLRPDFEPAYYEWASAQLGADQAAGALATLAQARARFAPNFLLELLSGLACAQQKAYGQALQHYAAAEVIANATDPRRLNHVFYLQVGAAHERKGDYQMAEKYFEKCLSLKPDYAEAQNYLGYMWAERGTNLVRARELLEQAVKTEPNNAAYLDSLAWVLFKLNEPAAALDQILKAVEHLESRTPPFTIIWETSRPLWGGWTRRVKPGARRSRSNPPR
jgi:tetratricopeptide (TPR) repeat protein